MNCKKNNKLYLSRLSLFLILISVLLSCHKETSHATQNQFGKLIINFAHYINNSPLKVDTLIYTNAAGNKYLINEIQYFISDITLHKNGNRLPLNIWEDIHYIDTDMPETQTLLMQDKIETGSYDSISFIFGINEEKNKSLMFVNPPERDMFWPEFLGGGYHYLKLNGKWENLSNEIYPFDFHLGIGQIYTGNSTSVDSIESFVHNHFIVNLPNSSFSLLENEVKQITFIMNIENWFQDPNTYDHNVWGSYIMQNQNAMQLIKENGADVFSIQMN